MLFGALGLCVEVWCFDQALQGTRTVDYTSSARHPFKDAFTTVVGLLATQPLK